MRFTHPVVRPMPQMRISHMGAELLLVVDRVADGYLATVTPYWADRENLGITGWELGPYETSDLAIAQGATEARRRVDRWVASREGK